MKIDFGLSSYARARGDFPALPVVNMVAEPAPTEERQIALVSRPGLTDRAANMGDNVQTLFQRDGVLGGAQLGVSNGQFYDGTSQLGTIGGAAAPSIAGNEIGAVVTGGSLPRFYDGASLQPIAFPDSADCVKVLNGASRFVFLRAGSGKFYWTPPLAATVAALDFATAESRADRLLDALFIDDILILFGAETIEYWPNTGDAALPFQPLEGRVIEKGIRATGCATSLGSTFAWVTNENNVCLTDENSVVSNVGLQKRIEDSAHVSLFSFVIDGNELLALRLDTETQIYNPRTQLWSEFASYGQTNWLPRCYAAGVFGCSDGRTAAWGEDYLDFGGELERRFRGGFPLNGSPFPLGNVGLRCNVGQTPYLSTSYLLNPEIEMRVSRDAGQTWGIPRRVGLGEQGKYRTRVEWRNCGLASRPGFVAEWRLTAPVPFRVSDVLLNEGTGGR